MTLMFEFRRFSRKQSVNVFSAAFEEQYEARVAPGIIERFDPVLFEFSQYYE